MGKRACGREHILCERAVALSMICTRQTGKPTARTVCGFASTPDCPAEQPRCGGSAITCARMLRMLRPMFSFPKILFRRPHTVITATVVACIIVARIIMVVVVFVVNAPLSMCLLFLLLFMHGGPGASKSATHPSEHGGLYRRAANRPLPAACCPLLVARGLGVTPWGLGLRSRAKGQGPRAWGSWGQRLSAKRL